MLRPVTVSENPLAFKMKMGKDACALLNGVKGRFVINSRRNLHLGIKVRRFSTHSSQLFGLHVPHKHKHKLLVYLFDYAASTRLCMV